MKKLLLSLLLLAAMLTAGIGLKAQEITITLNPGWNLISYPNAVAMDISSALYDFEPMEEDVIRSRDGSAQYHNGCWRGISQFKPGLGYMYYSMRTEPVSFAFAQVPSPFVTTAEPTNITPESVVVGGTVTMPEGSHVYQRGVCWGTEPNPIIVDGNHTSKVNEIGIVIGNGTFSDTLVGLNPNSTYYVRAYVISNQGIFFGNNEKRISQNVVSTDSVTDILGNGATCWGTVSNNSSLNVIERGVCWSKDNDNPTVNDSYIIDTISMDSIFVIMITNDLRPSTTYYVRAYAITEQNIYYGDVLIFTTMSGIPIVSTAEVIDINANSATCGGTVTDDGGLYVFERGICWSTNPLPTMDDSHICNGTGTGSFSITMTSLTSNTTYYVRAYARTAVTISYGNESSFTTQQPTYTINVSANLSAGGIVSGGGTYDYGSSCTLTATANTGYSFVRWMKNGTQVSTNPNYTFTVTENATYVAVFSMNSYTISVTANPSAGGIVNGDGTYNYGSSCTLTATANTGYSFIKWMKNGTQVSTNANYTFTVTENATYVAVFTQKSYTVSASANPTAGGSVSGAGTYTHGSSCTLTATPNTGYTFTKWTKNGTQVSTNASYTFTVTANATYVAVFTQNSYTISASASPTTGGSVSGAGTYTHGSSCTLMATPNTGYTFTKWMKNGTQVSTNANYTFTVTENATYVAVFSGGNVPTGAINGKFTINSSGSKVYFSQGNLQYIGSASTPYWKFADHQWDCLGNNGQGSTNQSVDRDLFGWGTSGYNHNNACYQPWSTNTTNNKYWAYSTSNSTYNLYNQTGKADWGYNKISNGGNTANSGWRTLTVDEWKYVLFTRNPSGPRFAKAKVNNVNGLIILPDDWNTSYYNLNNLNYPNGSFSSNTITSTQWQTLEQHGAVFLPAAGQRTGTSILEVGSYGCYWSSSRSSGTNAYRMYFYHTNYGSNVASQSTQYRSDGNSVRLVRPVQN